LRFRDFKNAKDMNKNELNRLSKEIIGLAIKVHKASSPGFPEKVYQRTLCEEFKGKYSDIKLEYKINIKYEIQLIQKYLLQEGVRALARRQTKACLSVR